MAFVNENERVLLGHCEWVFERWFQVSRRMHIGINHCKSSKFHFKTGELEYLNQIHDEN